MSSATDDIQIPSLVNVTFTEDWSVICDSQISPNSTLQIKYATSRLLTSQLYQDITFYVEIKFHEYARQVLVKRLERTDDNDAYLGTSIKVPVYSRDVTLWFKMVKKNGESVYDSNGGDNYKLKICGNAIMMFPYCDNVQTKGFITPGGTIRIIYDSRRLPGRDFYCGRPAWDIQAAMIEDNGIETRKVMTPKEVLDIDPVLVCDFDIPKKANFVSFWFKHWGHFGGDTFDNNCGRNYMVSFEYDAELWFTKDMKTVQTGYLLNGRKVCLWVDTNRFFKEDCSEVVDSCLVKQSDTKWLKVHVKFNDNITEREFDDIIKDRCIKYVLDIPVKAKEFSIWFTFGTYGKKEILFDSNYGQNYYFQLL